MNRTAHEMRSAWDAIADLDERLYVGDPERAEDELMALFGRLGADPRGGTCVEVGCGSGRMTPHLADRFDRVIAVDVSPRMIARAEERARARGLGNVVFEQTSGMDLAPVASSSAGTIVCYLVLQHLPSRELLSRYLAEFARILERGGEAFVHLPVLGEGLVPRLWRQARNVAVPVVSALTNRPSSRASFRGYRATWGEVQRMLAEHELTIVGHDVLRHSPYRFSVEVFLRLRRGR